MPMPCECRAAGTLGVVLPEAGFGNGLTWIERARRLAEYHAEAVDFVGRVGQSLPTSPSDAVAVRELWVEADRLDTLACSLLDEMNRELLGKAGELDTTRGASMRPADFEEEAVFFECSWLLQWNGGRGIMVNLAVEPRTQFYDANVHAMRSNQTTNLPHPISEFELKDGLVNAYVAEATFAEPGGPGDARL